MKYIVNIIFIIIITIILTEITLRYFHHEIFPKHVSSSIATGYHTGWGGIYRYDPSLQMNVMHPHFERQMYFNGYRWEHQTDWMGFRNPADTESADVVLLGDSMVYGHGVDETSTIRHHLAESTGLVVANLGMQGASAHQEFQIMHKFGQKLKPDFVFLFFLANDIDDLNVYLQNDQMLDFISKSADSIYPSYISDTKQAADSNFMKKEILERVEFMKKGLFLSRTIELIYKIAYKKLKKENKNDIILNNDEIISYFDRYPKKELAMKFQESALMRMNKMTDLIGGKFVTVFIYTGQQHYAEFEGIFESRLQKFCDYRGIDFISLRPEIEKALSHGEEPFLPGDGHFSDTGAAIAARVLSRYISGEMQPAPEQ